MYCLRVFIVVLLELHVATLFTTCIMFTVIFWCVDWLLCERVTCQAMFSIVLIFWPFSEIVKCIA